MWSIKDFLGILLGFMLGAGTFVALSEKGVAKNPAREEVKPRKLIVKYKGYSNYMGDPMPNKICRFVAEYANEPLQPEIAFEDSCHLYMIGDSITIK